VTNSDNAQVFAAGDGVFSAWSAILALGVFVCLYVSSLYSYLLFHGIAEIFSISVCACIFIITLNSRHFIQNGYLLFIGVAYFFVAVIDGVHTLAYKGMGVFPGYDANLPTQLWIAARYLQSISLLVAPAFFRKKPNLTLLFVFYTAISATLLIAIFSRDLFPDCFIEGVGLTSFKIISEYIISIILLVSLLLLALDRRQFESGVFRLLAASIIITILSELAFTSYVSVYGFFNLLGHFLKILAFFLVYKAIIETGFRRPYSLIFRELHEERQNLKAEIETKESLQKALKLREEKYRTVADFAYDWEYWINPEGRFVYVSPSCERVTGYKPTEFVANPNLLLDIILDEDRPIFKQHVERHLSNADSHGERAIDFRILHKNGEIRWIGHVSQAVYDNEQQFLGTRASNRDITERKYLERERAKAEEKSTTILESISDAFFSIDDNMVVTYFNQAAAMALGRRREEVTGQALFDVFPEARGSIFEQNYTRSLKEKIPLSFETYFGTPPYENWYDVRTYPDQNGISVFFQIITDRKRVERALQESEEKFAKVFHHAPALITLSNVDDGTYIDVNDKFCEISGFSREETIGKTSIDLGWVSQEDRIRLIEELQAQGSVRGMDLKLRTKDKRTIHCIYDGEFIQTRNGRMLLSIAQDVTERKRLEEERMETERKLLHAQKLESLGIMAGGIAHDFNNQLAVVLGNLELGLMDLPPNSEAKASIMNAIGAAKRSAELARQMLVYTGNTFYQPLELDLDELLNKIRDLLKSGVSKHVTLNLESYSDLPPIKGDSDQIQRLIVNLVSNASEAVGDKYGDVTIRTGVIECDEAYLRHSRLQEKPGPGRFVFLEVSDTGSGMDSETQYKLFDPFFSTKFWGRGLGMPEVMGIVKGHRGAIMVDSEVGKGTTVRVLFPAAGTPKMLR
jgi:PAS domain S-box-containing protein